MVRRIDPRQNSVLLVAEDYLFRSDALSMFRFNITHEMFLELGGLPKIFSKKGYFVISFMFYHRGWQDETIRGALLVLAVLRGNLLPLD